MEWKWFKKAGSQKTKESANLRLGPIKGEFMKQGNWSINSCLHG